jgi:hypothetical protein
MAYNMNKMSKVKKWFFNDFIKRNWEEIQYSVYDLYQDVEEDDLDDTF